MTSLLDVTLLEMRKIFYSFPSDNVTGIIHFADSLLDQSTALTDSDSSMIGKAIGGIKVANTLGLLPVLLVLPLLSLIPVVLCMVRGMSSCSTCWKARKDPTARHRGYGCGRRACGVGIGIIGILVIFSGAFLVHTGTQTTLGLMDTSVDPLLTTCLDTGVGSIEAVRSLITDFNTSLHTSIVDDISGLASDAGDALAPVLNTMLYPFLEAIDGNTGNSLSETALPMLEFAATRNLSGIIMDTLEKAPNLEILSDYAGNISQIGDSMDIITLALDTLERVAVWGNADQNVTLVEFIDSLIENAIAEMTPDIILDNLGLITPYLDIEDMLTDTEATITGMSNITSDAFLIGKEMYEDIIGSVVPASLGVLSETVLKWDNLPILVNVMLLLPVLAAVAVLFVLVSQSSKCAYCCFGTMVIVPLSLFALVSLVAGYLFAMTGEVTCPLGDSIATDPLEVASSALVSLDSMTHILDLLPTSLIPETGSELHPGINSTYVSVPAIDFDLPISDIAVHLQLLPGVYPTAARYILKDIDFDSIFHGTYHSQEDIVSLLGIDPLIGYGVSVPSYLLGNRAVAIALLEDTLDISLETLVSDLVTQVATLRENVTQSVPEGLLGALDYIDILPSSEILSGFKASAASSYGEILDSEINSAEAWTVPCGCAETVTTRPECIFGVEGADWCLTFEAASADLFCGDFIPNHGSDILAADDLAFYTASCASGLLHEAAEVYTSTVLVLDSLADIMDLISPIGGHIRTLLSYMTTEDDPYVVLATGIAEGFTPGVKSFFGYFLEVYTYMIEQFGVWTGKARSDILDVEFVPDVTAQMSSLACSTPRELGSRFLVGAGLMMVGLFVCKLALFDLSYTAGRFKFDWSFLIPQPRDKRDELRDDLKLSPKTYEDSFGESSFTAIESDPIVIVSEQ
eukprot:gnl/Dysnectes_brevis/2239_a2618_1070.p1 GENE.gnl/Dysnectes_brevis/2239_a2618_1070~~gnl/Dysnectes_brevis/2239_a2618_1070.p1  ORF type:complete len:917 (-),score=271.66 gnl/Dysnectes_brevis/2239_a2618_1070:186-2936(-)